ncbi:hypothetical protein BIV23_17410 [Streptomyces monashensis]|uniref:Uncharacterized protein n=1 Tax=Streptomyces monashensis TaxID=1678012 RepID=A0A1S2QEE0_9ACTN|nr:hypothetical protein BIV23_17410 [Streptomyces monashensis]
MVQDHSLTFRDLGPSLAPQAEQTWLVGSNLPILTRVRPYLTALYSSMRTNCAQPASCTLLASLVRASALIARSSTPIAWFSRIN